MCMNLCCLYQPAEKAFFPSFLFPQTVSEMSSVCCAQTAPKRPSANTGTVIWDVVQEVPQSPELTSERFHISSCQQFRYLYADPSPKDSVSVPIIVISPPNTLCLLFRGCLAKTEMRCSASSSSIRLFLERRTCCSETPRLN